MCSKAKIIVYRYDDENYADGQVVRGRGDSLDNLTDDQKTVEITIRSILHNGVEVRSTSLYTWANENLARRLWPFSKKKHLYELKVDNSDIRFSADLNWYSAAVDAVKLGELPQDAVDRYCSGIEAGYPFTTPRIEILVSKAKVIRKL